MTAATLFAFDNSYARLPERFAARLPPTPVAAPRLLRVNAPVARLLGLDPAALESDAGLAALSGQRPPEGAEPIAMAYAGHQFGNFVPQLGDGRAILLGEVVGPDGVRRDVQLKGSGRTPFSRMGDGRAAIGPVLREYVVSEGMAALGVRTTRALAAASTGETVLRERPLPGAVLTRVAESHVRVGTFQFFAARGDRDALRALADYVIARHYPQVAEAANPVRALLDAVVARQAALIARWMGVGFIHGVMNTDNMSVAGETIDYGPCAFMDAFHPGQVFSSIDQTGRYAYGNQPRIGAWNLAKLAECLLPLIDEDEERAVAGAQAAVDAYAGLFNAAWLAGMRAKLGLAEARAEDQALIDDLLEALTEGRADFTLFFRRLAHAAAGEADVAALFEDPAAVAPWLERWRARLAAEGRSPREAAGAMLAVNPAVIPRNHQVEAALAAAEAGDLGPFDALVEAVSEPFAERDAFMAPPRPEEVVRATFCGT
jgi:uncharacterized protein YdiU (UPF0061 family)